MERRKLTKEDIDKVRHIEGFPIGKDEDIIALSDAPYYTACPNPFIEEFIKENGTPYDEATDDYHREPFAADVSEGKSDTVYNMHTYHTKVPPKAILKYILHYTSPEDVVYDAFCGSGMTGVACAMAADEQHVREASLKDVIVGKRNCILCDVSPSATFISQGYNSPVNGGDAAKAAEKALQWLRKDFGWAYKTKHVIPTGQTSLLLEDSLGDINYTVWSDVYICPHCGEEFDYYTIGIDEKGHKKGHSISCPKCKYTSDAKSFNKAIELTIDEKTGQTVETVKEIPVLINYTYNGVRYEKKPDEYDFSIINKIQQTNFSEYYPTDIVSEGFKKEKKNGKTRVSFSRTDHQQS